MRFTFPHTKTFAHNFSRLLLLSRISDINEDNYSRNFRTTINIDVRKNRQTDREEATSEQTKATFFDNAFLVLWETDRARMCIGGSCTVTRRTREATDFQPGKHRLSLQPAGRWAIAPPLGRCRTATAAHRSPFSFPSLRLPSPPSLFPSSSSFASFIVQALLMASCRDGSTGKLGDRAPCESAL